MFRTEVEGEHECEPFMLGKIPLPTTKAGTSLSIVTPWSQSSCAQEPWGPGKVLRVSKAHEDRENEATVVGSGVEAVAVFIVFRGEVPEQASSGITHAICLKTTPAPQSSRTWEEGMS